MNLSELKNELINNKKISLPLVFIESNNDYLINSYLVQIAKNNSLKLREIKDINEMIDIENGMFKTEDYLYIYKYDSKDIINFDDLKEYNIIVITEKDIPNCTIDKVTFQKLLEWQIEDYVNCLIPGLNSTEIKWLCKIANYDLNRLENEASKLSIFNKKDQDVIFKEINDENGYCDLNDVGIFNLSNAIIQKDIVCVKKVLDNLDYIDVEGTGLVTLLLKNFLNVINIQCNPKATPENTKMSEKQFNYYRYYLTNKYSNDELINIYEFLNSIDYRLKSGLLDLSNHQLVYYIISNII